MVQYHALELLAYIKASERLGVLKLVSEFMSGAITIRSPLVHCTLLRLVEPEPADPVKPPLAFDAVHADDDARPQRADT